MFGATLLPQLPWLRARKQVFAAQGASLYQHKQAVVLAKMQSIFAHRNDEDAGKLAFMASEEEAVLVSEAN